MADIQSFRALRYDLSHVGDLSQVVAPPYDVINAELQSDLYTRHPANIVRIILNREEPGDQPGDNYKRAANFLKTWRRQGLLMQESHPAIYVYHQDFKVDDHRVARRGFVARVRLEPFGDGKIFPHEETHSKAKQDRLNLTRATECNTSQVFSIYSDEHNRVQETLESAIGDLTPCQATDDLGVVHKLWAVTDTAAIAEAAGQFGGKSLYIADGHHRYETGLNYQTELNQKSQLPADHPANYISMCCVSMSDPGMIVLPTHRLWRSVPEIQSTTLIEKLGDAFQCEPAGKGADAARAVWQTIADADDQGQLAFYSAADDTWVMVKVLDEGRRLLANAMPDHSEAWRSLGVSILHELIMPRLLGLDGLPSPKYVRGLSEVVDGLKQGDEAGRDATGQIGTGGRFEMATLVMPATIDHVRKISESGERMPAKSTYFYPKLLSGLILNPLTK